jgi:acetylornithine deacetylase/succinyl-diaminopimelate desuccinylase-like protein
MTDFRAVAIDHAQANQDRFLDELKQISAIASISTDPDARPEMVRAAEWLAHHMTSLGLEHVQIMPTARHPVVYADHLQAGPKAPTVLIYGHYDVQPAEPLELWTSGAFEPDVRGDYIYARGVTDMKGQVMATLNAVESILHTSHSLPVNIKFLIEGEEEIGSPSLNAFMNEHKALLACDLAVNPDTGMLDIDLPTITYALRGLAYFEIRVQGPDHDLHSGVFGGSVLNPAQALCELIAGMHNPDGSIALPGFYDRVLAIDAAERAELARLPVDDAWVLEQTGAPVVYGEAGYTSCERIGARPTLEVNGLYSGFTGEGSKTVLPSKAMAKVSCRLVPNQDPEEVHQSLLQYMREKAPAAIRWEVIKMTGGPASLSPRDSVGVQAMAQGMEAAWGLRPIFKREGGSVPVVGLFKDILGVDSVNTGFSMPGDNMHAPNEKMHLPSWRKGTEALIHFLFNLGA